MSQTIRRLHILVIASRPEVIAKFKVIHFSVSRRVPFKVSLVNANLNANEVINRLCQGAGCVPDVCRIALPNDSCLFQKCLLSPRNLQKNFHLISRPSPR